MNLGSVAAVLVGLAFVAAGLFKLIDGPAWPRQAFELGVSRPFALAVPWIEVGVGAALIVQLARPWPAVVAIAVLLVLTVFVVRRLRDDQRPPCACFGSRSNRPLGAVHVARNVVLLTLAVIAALAA